ncbi:DUF2254 domain-containing protein [Halalkalibacillus halophilus]|uniref:DUF2254 domain-containing protein n=1 Tax=Halalkalibacillus halophilus TaxID=392827 RepID=UPI000429A245|nr:DUF2254 domain-containing protein [Halalkalibacillus halophilus]
MNYLKKAPSAITKFWQMSKREKKHHVFSNIYIGPLIHAFIIILLLIPTVLGDNLFTINGSLPFMFDASFDLTYILLSTLTGGLLSLTVFTFYGVLTALTTFSAQFSPRILKNFMMTDTTQRTLGIFLGSFFYVLISLFLVNEIYAPYFFVPLTATLLAATALVTFGVFINHIVTWLQVTHMTSDMKNESIEIIEDSILRDLDPYRVDDEQVVEGQIPESGRNQIDVEYAGYLQTIEYVQLMDEAKKDNLVIKLEYTPGDFIFGSSGIISYWNFGDKEINEDKYRSMFHLGKDQTEIQDIEFSINKFVEIVIRALGNYDPKTAIGTMNEIGDLLINISKKVKFTPYLVDEDQKLRLILRSYDFEDYLYIGFASIRHYAKENVVVTSKLLNILRSVAQGVTQRDYESIWNFAEYTAIGFEYEFMHKLDKSTYFNALYEIATITDNVEKHDQLLDQIQQRNVGHTAENINVNEFSSKNREKNEAN